MIPLYMVEFAAKLAVKYDVVLVRTMADPAYFDIYIEGHDIKYGRWYILSIVSRYFVKCAAPQALYCTFELVADFIENGGNVGRR